MTRLNLDEALAQALAQGDGAGVRPDSAVGGGSASVILQLIEQANDIQAQKLRKVAPLLKKAVAKLRGGDARSAGKLCVEAMSIDPENAVATHVAAIAMGEMGALRLAFDLYERAIALDPDEPEIYHNLGLAAWGLEEFQIAEQFFRIFAAMTTHSALAANNLGGAVRDQGRYEEAIDILRDAIGQTPEDPNLWNTLGTVLVETGDDETALTFYNEALRLQPSLNRAQHNAAMALHSLGEPEQAVEAFDKALAITTNDKEGVYTRYSRSHSLLACGRLAEGWAEHESRLDRRFKRCVQFDVPVQRWSGESFEGKNLLLIGEQGLGDEILFLSAAPDLIEALGPNGKLTIVAERRFVELLQRSFPMANVFHHFTVTVNGQTIRGAPAIKDFSDFDFYAPMASVLQVLRPDLASFEHQQIGFLKPDPARVADFRARLDAAGAGPKAGFLWRSILMTPKRKRFYAPLESWRPALEAFSGTWVPMQYGECASDIAQLREWGLPILTFDDLDMKDDLDGVAALSAALDLIVGPPNATTNIAAGAGTEAWMLGETSSWTRLGTNKLPWYPRSKFFSANPREGWGPALEALRQDLSTFR
ncbi:MAG: tetratricopeptide repeat protein [Caulobacterales bacterium]